MTKKDFIALADALRPVYMKYGLIDVETLARAISTIEPRFKKDRWLGYLFGTCGPSGGVVRVIKHANDHVTPAS